MQLMPAIEVHDSGVLRPVSHTKNTSVAIIAHSRLVRESLHALLTPRKGLSMVWSAATSDWGRLVAMRPDVVLVQHDHSNSGAIRELAACIPNIKLIVIDAVPAELDVVGCLQYGVVGFALKDASSDDVMNAIHAVAEGGRVMPETVTERLCVQLSQIGKKDNRELWMGIAELTLRERQVVQFVLDGLSNKEIAAQMNISTCTVKTHMHNILEKLKITSRIDLINHCLRRDRNSSSLASAMWSGRQCGVAGDQFSESLRNRPGNRPESV